MQIKTVLAVDFGINQWGLAVGNTATRTALPIKAVKTKKDEILIYPTNLTKKVIPT